MCGALRRPGLRQKDGGAEYPRYPYFNGIVLDHFIFDNSIKRRVCIITEKEEALRQFIINDLHSGATIYEAIGAYNLEKHNEIITIVDKSEYQKLMNFINREDPKAFCYRLQCVQHAVSAQDLIGGRATWYTQVRKYQSAWR